MAKKPLSVLMLSWEFPPRIVGGIASHVFNLSKALVKLGVTVHVITCDFPQTPSYEEVEGVHVYRFSSYRIPAPNFLLWVFLMNKKMAERAMEVINAHDEQIDIIHAHDWLVADAAMQLKRFYGIPLVSTIHSTEHGRRGGIHDDYQKTIHTVESQLVHESSTLICCSNYMADCVVTSFNASKEKVVVINNGVDTAEFNVKTDLSMFRKRYAKPDEKIVLYVGRLVYEKGVHVLVGAIPKVLEQMANVKFIIVGEGGMKETLVEEAEYFGVADKVLFTGFVDRKTLISLYRCADVVVIPSLYEPFGITALEAMAAKTPVIASDTGGLKEIIQHEQTGIKAIPDNSDSIAWGILRVLKNTDLGDRIRKNAYQKLLNDYNWSRIAEETARIYQKLTFLKIKPFPQSKNSMTFKVLEKFPEEFQILLLLFTLGATNRERAKTAKELANILGLKVSHVMKLLQKLAAAEYVVCYGGEPTSLKYYLTRLGIIKVSSLFS
jgi:glycosyltransferase involved in cell wall biosynthesis